MSASVHVKQTATPRSRSSRLKSARDIATLIATLIVRASRYYSAACLPFGPTTCPFHSALGPGQLPRALMDSTRLPFGPVLYHSLHHSANHRNLRNPSTATSSRAGRNYVEKSAPKLPLEICSVSETPKETNQDFRRRTEGKALVSDVIPNRNAPEWLKLLEERLEQQAAPWTVRPSAAWTTTMQKRRQIVGKPQESCPVPIDCSPLGEIWSLLAYTTSRQPRHLVVW